MKPVFIMFIILNAKYHKYFTFYHTKLYSMSYFFLKSEEETAKYLQIQRISYFLSFSL